MFTIRLIGAILALALFMTGVEEVGKSAIRYFANEAAISHKNQFSLVRWNKKLWEGVSTSKEARK